MAGLVRLYRKEALISRAHGPLAGFWCFTVCLLAGVALVCLAGLLAVQAQRQHWFYQLRLAASLSGPGLERLEEGASSPSFEPAVRCREVYPDEWIDATANGLLDRALWRALWWSLDPSRAPEARCYVWPASSPSSSPGGIPETVPDLRMEPPIEPQINPLGGALESPVAPSTQGTAQGTTQGTTQGTPRGGLEVLTDASSLLYQLQITVLLTSFFALFFLFLLTVSFWLYRHRVADPLRAIVRMSEDFGHDPSSPHAILVATDRRDIIGVLQRTFVQMQQIIRLNLFENRRMAAVGESVLKIIHDVKNIMARIMIACETIMKDPKHEKDAEQIMHAVERVTHLVNRTLNYVTEERRSNQKKDLMSVSVLQVFEDVVQSLQRSGELEEKPGGPKDDNAAENPTDTTPDTTPGPVTIDCPRSLVVELDGEDLYRALLNLVQNALEAQAKHVSLKGQAHDGSVIITVCDDAGGLPDHVLNNLFTPFKTSSHQGGAGLGLAIAHELVTGNGGSFDLISTSENGTCFKAVFFSETP